MSSGSWSINDLIFLSYSRADSDQVEAIAAALRARGASVWHDAASTAGGSLYVESVQRALRRTSLMLVFVSANSVKSNWVADELRAYRSLMAREAGHKLLAVHLDKTRTPMNLADASAVDAHGVAPSDVANLIANVSGLASLTSAPSAPTAQEAVATAPMPETSAPLAYTAPTLVASGLVYLTYSGADWSRVQPLMAALRDRGVTLAEYGSAGLKQAQTLLVAISAESAVAPTVSEDLAAFQTLAASDPSRAIIGIHLDQSVSTHNLNGATAVDAHTISVDDVARLIVAELPAGAAPAAPEAASAAPATWTSAPAAAEEPEPTPTVVAPAVDVTDTAPGEAAPALDATETVPTVAAEAAPEAAVSVAETPVPVEETVPVGESVATQAPSEQPVVAAPEPEAPAPVAEASQAKEAAALPVPTSASPTLPEVAATSTTTDLRKTGLVALLAILVIAVVLVLSLYFG
jgi:hypothetical protein